MDKHTQVLLGVGDPGSVADANMDDAIATYLPSWLVRLDVPPSSRDPLGLQAHAIAQADRLLPGLNVFTSRARYYTFLCWALGCSQVEDAPPSTQEATQLERVLRLERLLVLCEALQHEDAPHACSYVGRRRGQRFVSERQNGWKQKPRRKMTMVEKERAYA